MLETIDDYPWNLMHFRAPASRTVLCPCVGQCWVAGCHTLVGLKGLAPAVSTKELPAQIYLSASCSCSWSAQVPSSHPLTKHPRTIQRPRLFVIR